MIWLIFSIFLFHFVLAAIFRNRGIIISFATAPTLFFLVCVVSFANGMIKGSRPPNFTMSLEAAAAAFGGAAIYIIVPWWMIGIPGSATGLFASKFLRRNSN